MAESKLILPGDPGFLSPENVNKLHSMDDVDTSATAHHHTLGGAPNQAAPGNHQHTRKTSTAGSPYIGGGNPYVHTNLTNLIKYQVSGQLWHVDCAQFLNAAPGSQRIFFASLGIPAHKTAAICIPGSVTLNGIGGYGIVWSPSESLWFLGDSVGSQVSGGWAGNTLLQLSATIRYESENQ